MHIIKKSRRPRLILLLAIAGALLVVAGGFAWWKQTGDDKKVSDNSGTRPINSVDYSSATEEDNKPSTDRKNNPDKAGETLNSPDSPPSFGITVTRATIENSAKQLVVGTLINGSATGTCTLTATKSGQSNVTATAQVATQGNAYSCPNFMIPFSKFPTRGEWEISVTVDNGKEKQTGNWPDPVAIPEG